MKTYLSNHLMLVCLITILTLPGLMTQSVNAEDANRTTGMVDVIMNADNDVYQCEVPLATPLLLSLTSPKDPPRFFVRGVTLIYRDPISHNVNATTWRDGDFNGDGGFGQNSRRNTRIDGTVIAPGPNEEAEKYILYTFKDNLIASTSSGGEESGRVTPRDALIIIQSLNNTETCTIKIPLNELRDMTDTPGVIVVRFVPSH